MKKFTVILSIMLMSTNVYAGCTYKIQQNPYTKRYEISCTGGRTYTYSIYKKTAAKTQSVQTAQTSRPAQTTQPTQTTQTTQTTKPTQATQTSQSTDIEQQILSLVNSERRANGLSPLVLDSGLCRVAAAKAEDMKNKGYFSHTSPTYGSPFDMLKSFGISYRTAGENIAKGQKTPQAVMTAWMNSQGHRKNILAQGYTKLGVGYVYNNGSPYWVQIFTG